jgi:hypothetical protein
MPKIRAQLFKVFHQEISQGATDWDGKTVLRPFAPYFIDQLVKTMRYARCLSERTYAWVLWRGQGNSSRWAVSDWDPENKPYFLDQVDCALDLAWFEEGRPLEWVEGMPKDYRQRARDEGASEHPKGVKDPAQISRAFALNTACGRLLSEGHKLGAAISPDGQLSQRSTARSSFEQDPEFLKWWKAEEPHNFVSWDCARSAYLESRKVGRTAYRRYRDRASFGGGILIEVITPPTEGNVSQSVSTPRKGLTDLLAPAPEEAQRRETTAEEAERPSTEIRVSQSPLSDVPTAALNTPEGLEGMLVKELGEKLPGEYPSGNLVRQVWMALDGAPIEWLRHRLRQRIKERYCITSYGFALVVAEGAGRAWNARQAQLPPPPPMSGTAAPCPRCADSGLMAGTPWTNVLELRAIADPLFCNCEQGMVARGLYFE